MVFLLVTGGHFPPLTTLRTGLTQIDRCTRMRRPGETVPIEPYDRAPQQPIAASFGAAVLYRGFLHWYRFPHRPEPDFNPPPRAAPVTRSYLRSRVRGVSNSRGRNLETSGFCLWPPKPYSRQTAGGRC